MKIYSLKHKKLGRFIAQTVQSGFDMFNIKFNDTKTSDFHYPNQVIFFNKKYNNYELWNMVEINRIPKGAVIEDQDGNQLIFTGKSFQIYYTNADLDEKYVGFCKGDIWRIVDINESEL